MFKKLEGIFVVMPTPFTEDEKIDYEAYGKNIDWLISKGVHGLIPLGSTGEVASLDDDERFELAEFVVKKVDGRVPVCVGTTAETTAKTIKFTKHAEEIGADAVLILPPYYMNPLQEEMINHFEKISDAVKIPIMLYNNPGTAGVDMELETVLKLAGRDNIQYIKESTGDITRLRDINRHSGGDITTFCGCEQLAFESFMLGAKGWVCVAGNAAPELTVALFEKVVYEKDYEKAKEIYEVILPLCIELENSGKLVQLIKYCLDKQGAHGGYSRAPRLPISDELAARIDKVLEDINSYKL